MEAPPVTLNPYLSLRHSMTSPWCVWFPKSWKKDLFPFSFGSLSTINSWEVSCRSSESSSPLCFTSLRLNSKLLVFFYLPSAERCFEQTAFVIPNISRGSSCVLEIWAIARLPSLNLPMTLFEQPFPVKVHLLIRLDFSGASDTVEQWLLNSFNWLGKHH